MNHQRLGLSHFQRAISAANQRFALIRKKYPNLRAYLVLSLGGDQAELDYSLIHSITEYPAMVLDSPEKSKTLSLIKKLKHLERLKTLESPETKSRNSTEGEIIKVQHEIDLLIRKLEFDGKAQVEIRFHHLDYELIWKLQTDLLVDRDLTPQSQTSIRIVSGTIADFERISLEQ